MESMEAPSTILVIFGITGDLSQRYLLSALSEIKKAGQLPKEFKIIGVSRRDVGIEQALGKYARELGGSTEIFQMDLDSLDDYKKLKVKLDQISASLNERPQVIFDLVIPPATVHRTITLLGEAGLNESEYKLLLEKPLGYGLGLV